MIKYILIVLFVLLLILQYKLWIEKKGAPQIARLQGQRAELIEQNTELEKQNKVLQSRIQNYQTSEDGFEERAREDLGMTKKDEVFYQTQ